jgi:hypothetical protein
MMAASGSGRLRINHADMREHSLHDGDIIQLAGYR